MIVLPEKGFSASRANALQQEHSYQRGRMNSKQNVDKTYLYLGILQARIV
jgi:hypothetical protein